MAGAHERELDRVLVSLRKLEREARDAWTAGGDNPAPGGVFTFVLAENLPSVIENVNGLRRLVQRLDERQNEGVA